jgi:PAS domain S-box-containing protein
MIEPMVQDTAPARRPSLPLARLLRQIIWFCILPLVGLASYLAIDRVRDAQAGIANDAQDDASDAALLAERFLKARIAALQMLAASPSLDEPPPRAAFYKEAMRFRQAFDGDIVLADTRSHMLLNTRAPLGSLLPDLPVPEGTAAGPTALRTGAPAVGDAFFGPVGRRTLVAIAVPVRRGGITTGVLLMTLDGDSFQSIVGSRLAPAGWSLGVVDSNGALISARSDAGGGGPERVYSAPVESARWRVTVGVPEDAFRAPLRSAALLLALGIAAATLLGVLGGTLAARRIGRAVASLSDDTGTAQATGIREVDAVRARLEASERARALARSELRQSEARFRAAFEQASVGVGIAGLDLRWLQVNRRLCEMVGYSESELLGMTVRDLTHPDDRALDQDWARRLIDGELCGMTREKRYVRKDGSILWVHAASALVRNAEGAPACYMGVIEDVSERRAAELARQASDARLRTAQENAHLGVWEFDPGAGQIYWSPECERLFAAGAGALQRRGGWQACVHPEDLIAVRFPWSDTDAEETQFEIEFRVRLGSGKVRWLVARGSRQIDPRGRVRQVSGVLMDNTEKRLLDAELWRHRHHLEELVASRTVDLEAARVQAEAGSRAKTAFLANMSHEIRTPLNAIVGLTHLLREAVGDATGAQRLDRIDAAARNLLAVLDDALDLARMDAGSLALKTAELSLDKIVDNVRFIVLEPARAKGLSVTSSCEARGRFLGDPTRIEQALLNYASNAVKFTSQGSVHLSARIIDEEAEVARVRLEVRDTGIGIAPETQAELFEAFTQADPSMTRRFGGTGLGLAITRRLARLMGGDAGVSSTPGEGSTFWFTAQLRRSSGVETAEGTASGPAAAAEDTLRQRHGGARVLVVEDNVVNQEVALELLERAGLKVATAGNGRRALECLEREHFDLVLMDLQMPEMDGITAARAIRSQPALADLPIVAVSANAIADDRAQCAAVGMNDFLAKPVVPELLYQTVLRWLPREAGRPAVSAPAPAHLAPDTERVAALQRALSALDVPHGLALVRGQVPKYLRLMRLFAEVHGGDVERLRSALAQARKQEALRLVHSLKGAAANIGARSLAIVAGDLEAGLRQESAIAGAAIDGLEVALGELVAQIRGLAGEDGSALPAAVAATTASLSLAQIETLLAAGDLRSGAVAESAAAALRSVLGEHFDEFMRRVRRFDHEGALQLLPARLSTAGDGGSA